MELFHGRFAAGGRGMDGASLLQHGDELHEETLAGFLPLGMSEAIEDGVAIAAVQPGKSLGGCGGRVKGEPEDVGDLDDGRGGVGIFLASIGAGGLNLAESGGLHAAAGDKGLGLGAVDPRPEAALAARRIALEIMGFA